MLEAKDTVMNQNQMADAIIESNELPMGQALIEHQAEISFKAAKDEDIEIIRDSFNKGYEKAKQAGIKEVVEWINRRILQNNVSSLSEWQTKVKEWDANLE